MNYFELFDIPVTINIEKTQLAKRFFELQKKYHPDFFTQEDETAQEEALEKTAALNKGFKVLRDRDSTIQYILKLKGLMPEEEKYALPPDFLMEVMELNESLGEHSREQVASLEKDIYREISPIIDRYDDKTISETDLLKLKEYYYKKKYLQRILDRMAG